MVAVEDRARSGVHIRAAALLVLLLVFHPVRMTTLRWWRVPEVAASLRLTSSQRDAIEGAYDRQLPGRRRCVERLVAASNRVDRLIDDGGSDGDLLRETQAVAVAALEERTLMRGLDDEIAAVLSTVQRRRLTALKSRRIVE